MVHTLQHQYIHQESNRRYNRKNLPRPNFDIMGGLANKFALDVIRVFYASYREIENTDMKTAMYL